MKTMSDELKPCPFCGGSAVEARTDDNGISWYIFCNDCGLIAGYSTTKEISVGVWNRRASDNTDSIPRHVVIDAITKIIRGAHPIEVAHQILPSPQPELKKGHWIRNDNGTCSCSVCQSWVPAEQRLYARYCLYCGHPMEVENDE